MQTLNRGQEEQLLQVKESALEEGRDVHDSDRHPTVEWKAEAEVVLFCQEPKTMLDSAAKNAPTTIDAQIIEVMKLCVTEQAPIPVGAAVLISVESVVSE